MKITKTASGSYRTVLYVGKDENGKRIIKTITAPSKAEVRLKANDMLDRYKNTKAYSDTFGTVAKSYMDATRLAISPNSHRERISRYNTIACVCPWFIDRKIYDIDVNDVQLVLNSFLKPHVVRMKKGTAKEYRDYVVPPCSPKTIKNYAGFISGVLKYRGIVLPAAKMPEKQIPDIYVPSDTEIKKILANATGELSICVRLAAFCLMREGEICALTMDDISGNVIHVHKDIAYDVVKGMVTKPTPKRSSSNRFIECPESLIADIQAQGYVTHYSPKVLRSKFKKLLKDSEVHNFRFHDLRHFGASTLHAKNVPDAYVQKRGGWSTPSTLQRIYRHTLADQDREMTKMANEHFDNLFSDGKH